MSTIKKVMDKVARQAAVTPPATWVGATNDDHAQLLDFLDDTIQDILKRRDWEEPVSAIFELSGDGSEAYNLPTDFMRIRRDRLAGYEKSTNRAGLGPVSAIGTWVALKDLGTSGIYRYYRITGYPGNFQILLFRTIDENEDIAITYVTNKWLVNPATSTYSNIWTTDSDILLLDNRLVQLGVRWRWLQQKGYAYDEYLNEYERYMIREGNDNAGVRKIVFGNAYKTARPWDIPVPAFVPPKV